MRPLRIPLYAKGRRLLGYWYLRGQRGDYKVTFRYPGEDHTRYQTDDPEHAVSLLYDAYIGYLGRRLASVDNRLAELPSREYGKPGFRKGWLNKLRRRLSEERAALLKQSRTDLLCRLKELRSAGWPTPPPPPLPWDDFDGVRAAAIAWIRSVRADSTQLSGGSESEQPTAAVRRRLSPAQAAADRAGRRDQKSKDGVKEGSAQREADAGAALRAGEPAPRWGSTWAVGGPLPDLSRKSAADRSGDRSADRAGATAPAQGAGQTGAAEPPSAAAESPREVKIPEVPGV